MSVRRGSTKAELEKAQVGKEKEITARLSNEKKLSSGRKKLRITSGYDLLKRPANELKREE